ncbi:MAG: DUF4197 domain-containing protein [Bacteroidota bacterium]|nr:DUF4197 domain-containing protein [Bacteroidota bacterium]
MNITKIILFAGFLTLFCSVAHAQLMKGAKDVFKTARTGLSQDEAAEGIKEALIKGVSNGVQQVNKTDGYFKNPKIKIPFPPDAQNAEAKLRSIGFGEKVDEAILALNRAAEDAAHEAKPIFMEAIKALTINDALNLVRGEKDAATQYLQKNTTQSLTDKFKPIIGSSLEKVNATKYWESIMSTHNKIPLVQKVNPDLEAFVTERAIMGLFTMVAQEELEIRNNPGARTSETLKKVFGN